ncbi:hypothetical protein L7F22_037989 [Adiantum nelumboides]|nr:hypothetical protein [Adiantum nelumboides]
MAAELGTNSFRQDMLALGLIRHPNATLDKLEHMQHHGVPLWRDILYVCMQACNEITAGRRIHSLMVSSCFDSVSVLGDPLIRLFGACQSLFEANVVFCALEHPSEFSWQSITWTYHVLGEHCRVSELYEQMHQQQGFKPGKYVISTVLKSCGAIQALSIGMLVHRDAICAELHTDVVVGSCLIDMYVNCSCLQEARAVFDKLPNRNEIVWNVMIEGYAQHGHALSALYLFERMQECGIKPGKVTFLCVLGVCEDSSRGLLWGRYLHNLIVGSQLESAIELRSALVNMYARLGSLNEAFALFVVIPNKNAVEWGAMISGYAQHGQGHLAIQVFEDMQRAGLQADEVLFSSVLKGIADMKLVSKGMRTHSQIVCRGLDVDVVLGSSLIDMYAGFSDLNAAHRVFSLLSTKNVISWSLLIAGYAMHLDFSSAFRLFLEMQQDGIEPDRVTFIYIFGACSSSLATLPEGRILHSQIIEQGFDSVVAVSNNLVRMFAKCGSPEDALSVFDGLSSPQAEAWGELISACVQSGLDRKALALFERTLNEGIMVGRNALVSVLKACGKVVALSRGKIIHGQFINKEYKSDMLVGNSLLEMYVNCGAWKEAREVFSEMGSRDLLSWVTMMTGYNQSGESHHALQLFEKMQQDNLELDIVSFSCALKACCNIGSLEQGRVVHDQILRSGLQLDPVAGNTLVDLYAKCGSLQEARKVFDGLSQHNQVSWNSLIAGYADHGGLKSAEECLADMQGLELKPSATTYSSVFSACGHAGQVEESRAFFQSMTEDYHIAPTNEHFNCMVDNFARAGQLCEAKELLYVTPGLPDEPGWTSLLTACKVYTNSEIGKQCYKKLGVLDGSAAAAKQDTFDRKAGVMLT